MRNWNCLSPIQASEIKEVHSTDHVEVINNHYVHRDLVDL